MPKRPYIQKRQGAVNIWLHIKFNQYNQCGDSGMQGGEETKKQGFVFPKREELIDQIKCLDDEYENVTLNLVKCDYNAVEKDIEKTFSQFTFVKIKNYNKGSFEVIFQTRIDAINFIRSCYDRKILNRRFFIKMGRQKKEHAQNWAAVGYVPKQFRQPKWNNKNKPKEGEEGHQENKEGEHHEKREYKGHHQNREYHKKEYHQEEKVEEPKKVDVQEQPKKEVKQEPKKVEEVKVEKVEQEPTKPVDHKVIPKMEYKKKDGKKGKGEKKEQKQEEKKEEPKVEEKKAVEQTKEEEPEDDGWTIVPTKKGKGKK